MEHSNYSISDQINKPDVAGEGHAINPVEVLLNFFRVFEVDESDLAAVQIDEILTMLDPSALAVWIRNFADRIHSYDFDLNRLLPLDEIADEFLSILTRRYMRR